MTTINQDVNQLVIELANEINNQIEYKLTINEYHSLRNSEYLKLVNEGKIEDTDDNWDSFDCHLGSLLNVNWG